MGYLCIIFYCLFNAYSFVFIAGLGENHNQALSIVAIFSLGLLAFNVLNLHQLSHLYRKSSKHIGSVLGINISSAASWLACFYSLRYIDPATMLCVVMATIPITTFLVMTPLSTIKNNLPALIAIALIVITMILIVIENISVDNRHYHAAYFIFGVVIALIGGVFGAFIGTYSERLHKAGFSVSEILALRFYLLILAGFIILFNEQPTYTIDLSLWKLYSISTIIVIMLPLVIYQKAISHLGSLTVSLLIPFTPIVAYFIQLAQQLYPFHLSIFVLIISCCVTIFMLNLFRTKNLSLRSISLSVQ